MLVAYGYTSGRQILSSEVSLGVITAPNAELVAICLVTVQAASSNIRHIIITDSLSAVKNDSTPQSGQCQSITIAKYLRIFSNPTLRFLSSSGIVLARQDALSRLKLKRMIVFPGSGSIHIS